MNVANIDKVRELLSGLGSGSPLLGDGAASFDVVVMLKTDKGDWKSDGAAAYKLEDLHQAAPAVGAVLSLEWPSSLDLVNEDGDETTVEVVTSNTIVEFRDGDKSHLLASFCMGDSDQCCWAFDLHASESDAMQMRVYTFDHDFSSLSEPECETFGELLAAWVDGIHPFGY